MKIAAAALSLAIAAAAGGTTMFGTSVVQPDTVKGSRAAPLEVARDSRLCRWLGRHDADSMIRLWFTCRG